MRIKWLTHVKLLDQCLAHRKYHTHVSCCYYFWCLSGLGHFLCLLLICFLLAFGYQSKSDTQLSDKRASYWLKPTESQRAEEPTDVSVPRSDWDLSKVISLISFRAGVGLGWFLWNTQQSCLSGVNEVQSGHDICSSPPIFLKWKLII